jgi:hypothetical protein
LRTHLVVPSVERADPTFRNRPLCVIKLVMFSLRAALLCVCISLPPLSVYLHALSEKVSAHNDVLVRTARSAFKRASAGAKHA